MGARTEYVVCLRSEGEDDLEVRKLYIVLPDESAAEVGYMRVIDESGEDYLYPAKWFAPVEISEAAARELSTL